jgi:hypothetical protein
MLTAAACGTSSPARREGEQMWLIFSDVSEVDGSVLIPTAQQYHRRRCNRTVVHSWQPRVGKLALLTNMEINWQHERAEVVTIMMATARVETAPEASA